MPHKPRKIISGGQTGADRAALDLAIELGIDHGGCVPKGRLAEDGRISKRYDGLVETETDDPAERTRLNVNNSDATLIISQGTLVGGSKLTQQFAKQIGKPELHIDLSRVAREKAIDLVTGWLAASQPTVLNIAGPRGSEDPQIYRLTFDLLAKLFKKR